MAGGVYLHHHVLTQFLPESTCSIFVWLTFAGNTFQNVVDGAQVTFDSRHSDSVLWCIRCMDYDKARHKVLVMFEIHAPREADTQRSASGSPSRLCLTSSFRS